MTKYTYIGSGESSPSFITFMGRVDFMLGEEVEVTDEVALKKLKGNKCFKEGSVDSAEIMKSAKVAKEEANAQRKEDAQTQINASRTRKR